MKQTKGKRKSQRQSTYSTAPGSGEPGGVVSTQEMAVLVCLEVTGRPLRPLRQATIARQAAEVADLEELLAAAPADPDAQDNTTTWESSRQKADLRAEDRDDDRDQDRDEDFAELTAEFRELVRSAGAAIAGEIVQRRDRPDAATLIGPGKVEEVAALAASVQADVVIFGHDLSPSQLRNLEQRLPCRVVDRTQLILDIFARHARTREGQLQVELAQLQYLLPRLAGRGKAMSQLGGGIGTRGPGETKLETDRRRIHKRVDHIKSLVEQVRRTRRQQRQRREAVPVPTVALVGYTNAGKSTLFNALTRAAAPRGAAISGVMESSRMFATLDPKLRAITLPSRRKILLADTVGFVRQLPHTLVTSFRATLEEVETAEVLLHVRDASSSHLDRQKQDVEQVLAELEIADKTVLEVLNKADLLPAGELAALAQREQGIVVSGLKSTGLGALLQAIEEAMRSDQMQSREFRLPQSEGRVLAALEAGGTVSSKRYEGNVVYLNASGPASLLGRYRRFQYDAE